MLSININIIEEIYGVPKCKDASVIVCISIMNNIKQGGRDNALPFLLLTYAGRSVGKSNGPLIRRS